MIANIKESPALKEDLKTEFQKIGYKIVNGQREVPATSSTGIRNNNYVGIPRAVHEVYQRKRLKVISRHKVVEAVLNSISQEKDQPQPFVITVVGKLGVGKTTFSKELSDAIRNKFNSRNVVYIATEDFHKRIPDQEVVSTHEDLYDLEQLDRLQQSLALGKTVYKPLFNENARIRLSATPEDVEDIKANGETPIVNDDGKTLLYDDKMTKEMRQTGRISSISKVFIDISDNHYDLVESFDPRNAIVVFEGVMAAYNLQSKGLLIYVTADEHTRRENISLRSFKGTRYQGSEKSLKEILGFSRFADDIAHHLYEFAEKEADIILDRSRDLYPAGRILEVAEMKNFALESGRTFISPAYYDLIKKCLLEIVESLKLGDTEIMPIAVSESDENEHIELILRNVLLEKVLDDESVKELPEARNQIREFFEAHLKDSRISNMPGILLDRSTGHISFGDQPNVRMDGVELWIERHGQTFVNVDSGKGDQKVLGGGIDAPQEQLTDKGKEQARASAPELFEKLKNRIQEGTEIILVTSPLKRAKDTARPFIEYMAGELERQGKRVSMAYAENGEEVYTVDGRVVLRIIVDPRLTEMNYGDWSHQTVGQLSTEKNKIIRFHEKADATVAPNNGESFISILARTKTALQDYKQRFQGKVVVLFSHKYTLVAVRANLGDRTLVSPENPFIDWIPSRIKNAESLQLTDQYGELINGAPGGIDLTRDRMNIQTRGSDNSVQFNFDPAMIQQLQNAAGLTPVIIDIQPMTTTVPMFLGVNDVQVSTEKLSIR